MKDRLKVMVFSILFMLFLFSGCSTTPEKTGTTTGIDKSSPAYDAYTNATNLRNKVEKYGFATLAPDDYKNAEEKYKSGMTVYSMDSVSAKQAFTDAADKYRVIIKKGIAGKSSDYEKDIDTASKKADTMKASVALAEDYKKAKEKLKKAGELVKADDWEGAETLYIEAKAGFDNLYVRAKEMRDKAQLDFNNTNKKIKDINATEEEYKKIK
jgi:hypothetical protein